MNDDSTISPWSHPKAQEWFATIFDRSGALLRLKDEIFSHGEDVGIPQIRLYASLLILLGREGIWPAHERGELVKMAQRLSELLRERLKSPRGAMTVEEHQTYGQMVAEAEHEVELLRRGVGLSKRLNQLGMPGSWQGFWNS